MNSFVILTAHLFHCKASVTIRSKPGSRKGNYWDYLPAFQPQDVIAIQRIASELQLGTVQAHVVYVCQLGLYLGEQQLQLRTLHINCLLKFIQVLF